VKEAWETKRDALERTGNLVIEQLKDALSAKASSQDLANDLAVVSLDQCVEKVWKVLHSLHCMFPRIIVIMNSCSWMN
jgi:hypothetical protein